MADPSEERARKRAHAIFVTGTDTGVGKTIAATAIALGLQVLGHGPLCVMKPVETGCRVRGGRLLSRDARFHQRMLGLVEPEELLCPVRLRHALAPQSAAALEGRVLRKSDWLPAFRTLTKKYDFVLVEGAGGVMVPVREEYLISDMILDLAIPCVVVARTGLGTINHTLLTVEHLRGKGISILGLVFNQGGGGGRAGMAERTGPALASALSGLPILGVIPRLPSLTRATLSRAGKQVAVKVSGLVEVSP